MNTKDDHGDTPLHKACRVKNGTFVKILLDSGADVNTKNKLWATPLLETFHNGSLDTFKALIKYGGDVNAQRIAPQAAISLVFVATGIQRIVPQAAFGYILTAAGITGTGWGRYYWKYCRQYHEELCGSDQDRMRLKHLCRMVVRHTLMRETRKETSTFWLLSCLSHRVLSTTFCSTFHYIDDLDMIM